MDTHTCYDAISPTQQVALRDNKKGMLHIVILVMHSWYLNPLSLSVSYYKYHYKYYFNFFTKRNHMMIIHNVLRCFIHVIFAYNYQIIVEVFPNFLDSFVIQFYPM